MLNVQTLRLRLSNYRQDLHDLWNKITGQNDYDPTDQKHVMTEDEKVDEASKESFPASDPPGHFSKSLEDRELH